MNLKKYPELVPVVEWWEKDGKKTVVCLVAVLAVFVGYKVHQAHRASVKAAASNAVVASVVTADLEAAVAQYGDEASGGLLKLRLAKSYYEAGQYENAMAKYEELAKDNLEGFADIPAVGKAHCLEALGRADEALAAFDAFVAANPKHYLTLTAQLGAARCLAAKGDKDAALARLAAVKDSSAEDQVAKMRIEETEALIKRTAAQ